MRFYCDKVPQILGNTLTSFRNNTTRQNGLQDKLKKTRHICIQSKRYSVPYHNPLVPFHHLPVPSTNKTYLVHKTQSLLLHTIC